MVKAENESTGIIPREMQANKAKKKHLSDIRAFFFVLECCIEMIKKYPMNVKAFISAMP